ncbi:MAG: hypothetical protein OXI18_01775 [bacterium]|nr:hypothetical protein [bacterium]
MTSHPSPPETPSESADRVLREMKEAVNKHILTGGGAGEHKRAIDAGMNRLMEGCSDEQYIEGWRIIEMLIKYEDKKIWPHPCCLEEARCKHAVEAADNVVWLMGMPVFKTP